MNWKKSCGTAERALSVILAVLVACFGNWDAATFFVALGIFSAVTRHNER